MQKKAGKGEKKRGGEGRRWDDTDRPEEKEEKEEKRKERCQREESGEEEKEGEVGEIEEEKVDEEKEDFGSSPCNQSAAAGSERTNMLRMEVTRTRTRRALERGS